ncbi:DUF7619 domain-containing protein [Flavobacterium wongokense]|uniref:DUF7619 domain-containing protein n=1 Tax=Flavobacterium wongokense TaxID=2910674 RepID=UPI001F335218|nr:T9SS type A sorting domain-containing protein [Flavobacterium sp. WG47]MCF6130717.1 T9SS type A sorting domain-containing protein [Flavobacterium sp. WG47]
MKKLLPFILLVTGMVNAQFIDFPDFAFKSTLLLADYNNPTAMDSFGNQIRVDLNQDGEIEVWEASFVTQLNVRGSGITNLSGISEFTNLTRLDCSYNSLNSLDVSGLPALTQLTCSRNQLTSLNLTGASNLSLLFCSYNQLSNIDVTGTPQLTFLDCSHNNIQALTINGLANLAQLSCNDNLISNLSLANLTSFAVLQCDHNLLTSLDVSNVPSLTQLYCYYNQLTSLDLSGNTALTRLGCGENSFATLNLNGLSNLNYLECNYLPNNVIINGNGLTALTYAQYIGSNSEMTFNGFPNLENLNLTSPASTFTLNLSGFNSNAYVAIVPPYDNIITSLTVNGVGPTAIKTLYCPQYNQLASLTLNGLNGLSELICAGNKLTSLNLSNLPNLTYLNVGQNLLTSLNLSGTANLKHLDVNNNKLTALNISGLTALEYLDFCNHTTVDINGNQISSIDLSGLTNLKYFDCSNYGFDNVVGAHGNMLSSLSVNHLTQLEDLKCSKNNIAALTINNLIHLTNLDCSHNLLTSLDLVGLTSLTNLNYSYNQLENLNMVGLVNITDLDCSYNNISTLNLSTMPNLRKLACNSNALTTLNLDGLTLITDLSCDNNQLTTLDLTNMSNLYYLSYNNNQVPNLDFSQLPNLFSLQCGGNHMTTIDVSPLTQLQVLNCDTNDLTTLDISNLTHLSTLQCVQNHLTTLDLSHQPILSRLDCSSNSLTTIDLSTVPELWSLACANNGMTALDLSHNPRLYGVYCNDNLITTLDVSNMDNLHALWFQNNPLLTEVFMKNGSNETILRLNDNPSLTYICADEAQLASIQSTLNGLGMTTTVSNSYCTFSPGGPHNTVIGTTIFDGNNNGCNLNDPLHPNIRVDFSGPEGTGSAFTNTNGTCTFYADSGNYTLFPNIENAAAFNISPASASINFSDNNNNISNQSFCLSANGVHSDVEIVLSPVSPARPGFDATYKLTYKNKGNQVLSGNVTLAFEDAKMDLTTAIPAVDTQTPNNLDWAYTSLLPFESRTINLVFTINAPPAVNIDDVIHFTASITPSAGDENPSDNTFAYNQTVVGSFDPNDITCLEGDTVSPTEIGNYLHYVVNFENTGNYQAENVVVRDVIDTDKYDLATLQVLSTSYDSYTRIIDNVVEFVFQGINLAPRSGNPPVGGHGDVLFKIKTKGTINPNETVIQRAGIYFDYNAPVQTTDAETTFVELSNPIFEFDNSVKIYPNPTNSMINIASDFAIESIELYDVQGRILERHFETASFTKLDISNKSNGIYFLKIKTEKGSKVEKVVKQ